MKLSKIGIIAALSIMGYSSACSANSLSEALANGDFKGQIKALYIVGSDTDVRAAKGSDNRDNASIAIEGNYISGDFYGLKIGISAQSGYDFRIHDENVPSEDDSRNTVTSTHFHEAFLDYAYGKTSFRLGRQIIKTPLLMNSSAFPMKDSFDAFSITSKIIPDTIVKAIYVDKWNKRYGHDSNGGIVQEDKEYDKGLYTLYVKNNSIENLTLDGQYLTTNEKGNNGDPAVMTTDGYDEYFLRTNYKINSSIPLTLGAFYTGANFDKSGEENASIYGLKIGTKINGIKLNAAYTSVDDKNDYPGALGHVPDVLIYTNGLVNKAMYAGVDAISLEAIHNFGIENFSARAKYIHFDQSDEGMRVSVTDIDRADEINLDLRYKFTKDLSTRLFMGHAKYDQDVEEDAISYARLYLVYSF